MVTVLSPEEWDAQYGRQAGWTRGTRRHLYRRVGLLRANRVLDVGSGTGIVTEELASNTQARVTGIDLDRDMVAYANKRDGRADYQWGDAHDLPFVDGHFDVTVCHFLLLWCRDPVRVAREMVRVTRPSGWVLVCAEPDYGGRIDHPDLPLGHWQAMALRREGADPNIGRKLRGLFARGGSYQASVGLIPGLWDLVTMKSQFDEEWSLWRRSLADLVPSDELERVRAADKAAIEAGERLVFMPVFYALIRV